MQWLKILKSILEIAIPLFGYLGKKKVEKELEVVATGVENFSRASDSAGKGDILKKTIHDLARISGVEDRLNQKVKKWEERLWNKVF